MIDISKIDYSTLDRPEILNALFHPRTEWEGADTHIHARNMLISVETNVVIGARFHMSQKTAPNMLYFHGNGEIVADYDELGPIYNRMGINFIPVDYRGYGRSTGRPTLTAMMRDCHIIFEFVRKWLKENDYNSSFIAMGRSLGSASVIELAANYGNEIDGLIVESGFAYAGPLLQLLGVDLQAIEFKEERCFRNLDKIRLFEKPTLIIHAEHDHIIPFADGQALFEACRAEDKTLLKIPEANHNDIFQHGFSEYMEAVKILAGKTVK